MNEPLVRHELAGQLTSLLERLQHHCGALTRPDISNLHLGNCCEGSAVDFHAFRVQTGEDFLRHLRAGTAWDYLEPARFLSLPNVARAYYSPFLWRHLVERLRDHLLGLRVWDATQDLTWWRAIDPTWPFVVSRGPLPAESDAGPRHSALWAEVLSVWLKFRQEHTAASHPAEERLVRLGMARLAEGWAGVQ